MPGGHVVAGSNPVTPTKAKALQKRAFFYFQTMSYYAYILYSQKLGKHYVGSSGDVQKRLIHHNSGRNKFSKKGVPWSLVWSTQVETASEARQLELKIKKRGAQRYLTDIAEV